MNNLIINSERTSEEKDDCLHFESGACMSADVELAAVLGVGVDPLRLSSAWTVR